MSNLLDRDVNYLENDGVISIQSKVSYKDKILCVYNQTENKLE